LLSRYRLHCRGSEVIEGGEVLKRIHLLATALVIVIPWVLKLHAVTQPAVPSITPQMTELVQAHSKVLERMNALGVGGKLRPLDDAEMSTLCSQGWKLASQWAGAWLDLNPDSSAKDLNNIFVDFTPPPRDPAVYDPNLPELYAMEGSATRIATDIYVVRAVYEESQSASATSTFFVVARDANGHFLPKWSIKPLAERHYRKRDEIGLWAFLGECAYYCGPLLVQEVIFLPPSENGQPRFAIDASQATNGNTLMKQLSVWQWNGTEAENLVIRSYKLYIDEDREIQLVGDLLSVPTKEETSSFSSFGCCAEPRGIWILRITPDGVRDLGHRFVQPQIQWADRLLAASRSNSPAAANLASPSVLSYLWHTEFDDDIIDQCHVLNSGKKGAFEISFGEGVTLWLSYRLRNGQPYFTDIHVK
jgi:hypothetical protein